MKHRLKNIFMKYGLPFHKKGMALTLAVIFLTNGMTFPGYAEPRQLPQTASISVLNPKVLEQVSIPVNWGEVSASHAGSGPVVILIQDAHAVPDAQKNIHA